MNLLQRVFKLNKRNDLIRLFDKYNARQDNLIEQSYERNVDAYAVVIGLLKGKLMENGKR